MINLISKTIKDGVEISLIKLHLASRIMINDEYKETVLETPQVKNSLVAILYKYFTN